MSADVSFIVPCFNEEESIEAFYRRFREVFNQSILSWELVFVDDGSRDDTYHLLREIAASSENVTVIRFSRNFGKEAGIYAGLENAHGDIVGIIDADLQQDPCIALKMVQLLLSKPDYDCVAAYQENRREGKLTSLLKNQFYRILAGSSGMNVIADASDFRVFRRQVVDAILSLSEQYRFSKGIFSWIGFETLPFPYTPEKRFAGKSKWSFFALLRYAIEGITSFTVSPLRFAIYLGLTMSILAITYCIAVLVRTLTLGIDVPGYATTIGVVLLLGGVQLFVMGIIGEYLGRTYMQGKQRPIYIAKSIHLSQYSNED